MNKPNFEILYMEKAPLDTTRETNFYQKEGRKNGFQGVYTQEGYYLSSAIYKGKNWHEWFTEMRGKEAVQYKQDLGYYSEDYATVIDCLIVAYNQAGDFLGSKKLASTYIGASDSNHGERGKEFEASIPRQFNKCIQDVETYLLWKGWAQAKGLEK